MSDAFYDALCDHQHLEGYEEGYKDGYEAGKRDAQPHWVSVEERLPDKVGSYLTAYCDGFVCENQWHYTGITAIGWINDGEAVRYWMPLPEPPKEDA